MDPFATLGLARTFDVDLAQAERAHRDLLRTLHPDRYAGTAPSERREALAKAIEVNDAWRIVRDPIGRAQALLALAGLSREGAAERESLTDAEFLMEMLEQREALAEASQSGDPERVRRLADGIRERARAVEDGLSLCFSSPQARWQEEVIPKLGELKFYRRFLEEVSAIEDEASGVEATIGDEGAGVEATIGDEGASVEGDETTVADGRRA